MTLLAKGEREMELRPVETRDLATQIVSMAANADLDVAKLQALIGMQRDAAELVAKSQFNKAMNRAQKAMRPISADAENPQTRSKYASYAQLDNALRPIYTEHGFGLSFDTADCPLPGHIRVVCEVTHDDGYSKTHHVDMPADGKGAKGGDVMTLTHAVGAGLAYGMRYLVKMIFNVAVGELDRDGNAPAEKVMDPSGFGDWSADLELVAKEQGFDALKAAWTKSKPTFREHMTKQYGPKWEALKKASQSVKA